jgi:hypothetical protein
VKKFSEKIMKRRAKIWWNKLSESQKRNVEFDLYGYGDPFEDNSISDEDIVQIYRTYNYKKNIKK